MAVSPGPDPRPSTAAVDALLTDIDAALGAIGGATPRGPLSERAETPVGVYSPGTPEPHAPLTPRRAAAPAAGRHFTAAVQEGQRLLRAHDWEAALAFSLERLIPRWPHEPHGHFAAGTAALRLRRLEAAVAHLSVAAELLAVGHPPPPVPPGMTALDVAGQLRLARRGLRMQSAVADAATPPRIARLRQSAAHAAVAAVSRGTVVARRHVTLPVWAAVGAAVALLAAGAALGASWAASAPQPPPLDPVRVPLGASVADDVAATDVGSGWLWAVAHGLWWALWAAWRCLCILCGRW